MKLGLGLNIKTSGGTDFNPSSLGSTLDLWYQYNTGLTNLSGTDGNSDNRMQWLDQSGNARHAQQDTDAKKPTITSGYLDFEDTSVNDYMEIATGTSVLDYGGTDTFTLVVAVRRESKTTADRFIGSTVSQFIGFVNQESKLQLRANSGLLAIQFDDDYFPINADYIVTVTKDADGNILVYKNSNVLSESGGGTSQLTGSDMDLTQIGSQLTSDTTTAFDGRMYEFIVCNTVLSTSDRNLTIDYLKNKLSIS
tara:strand:- start:564 stop:1319 length:756 start_codon:yes stop_codon:yes gene_type:complete